jgi:hypothetical protein
MYPPGGACGRTHAHFVFDHRLSRPRLDVEFVIPAFVAPAQDPKAAQLAKNAGVGTT